MKAQLMTISVLILFILMLAELIIFITLSTGYNNLSQAYSQQTNLANYGSYMTSSSSSFAAGALRNALFSLAGYENLRPINRRGTNLITNSSLYLA